VASMSPMQVRSERESEITRFIGYYSSSVALL